MLKHFFIPIFFSTILSCTLILPMSQLQAQQLMTPQIMSRIEYLIAYQRIVF